MATPSMQSRAGCQLTPGSLVSGERRRRGRFHHDKNPLNLMPLLRCGEARSGRSSISPSGSFTVPDGTRWWSQFHVIPKERSSRWPSTQPALPHWVSRSVHRRCWPGFSYMWHWVWFALGSDHRPDFVSCGTYQSAGGDNGQVFVVRWGKTVQHR
jgi:hypothetical protein